MSSNPTETVYLGSVTDALGEVLNVHRTPNGGLLVYGSVGTKLGFDPGARDQLRELLDRAAMPGQPGGVEDMRAIPGWPGD